MALHFILDGYNLVKRAFDNNSKSLKSSREKFLAFVEKYHPQGSPRNKITVVFDGKEDFSQENYFTSFKVIFSKGEDADSCIRGLVEKAANPKNIVVVTNDKELKFFARRSGTQIMSTDEFLSKVKVYKHVAADEGKELSFYLSNKITSELGDIWLKKG